jgi:hypothetical protein
MKKVGIIFLFFFTFFGCNQSRGKQSATAHVADPNVVYVFNFHGKQRCLTCNTMGNVAKSTVENSFADNEKVRFIEINASEKANEELVKKYEVFGSSLVIAKGNDFSNITQQAFATAVRNPQSLESLIKEEVNKRL